MPATASHPLKSAGSVSRQLSPAVCGLGFEGMRDWLMATGALQIRGCELTFRPALAREVFAQCATGGFRAYGEAELWSEFAAGRVAYCIQSSYHAIELLRGNPFRWVAWPVPLAVGASLPGTLSLLAMRASTLHPQDCMEAVRCLLETDIQCAYGRLGGNLPVAADAIAALAADPDRPPQLPSIDSILDATTQVWDRVDNFRIYWSVYVASGLVSGRVTPDEAVERVHLALELLPYTLNVIT